MNKLTETIIEAISDKKGQNIVMLDLSKLDGVITGAFVICNADSSMQVEAIERSIEEKVQQELGEKVWRVEGLANGIWVVMDYIDVMVHIFQTETRGFYKLEELWEDAPIIRFNEDGAPIEPVKPKPAVRKKAVPAEKPARKPAAKKPAAVKTAAAKTPAKEKAPAVKEAKAAPAKKTAAKTASKVSVKKTAASGTSKAAAKKVAGGDI